MTLSFTPRGTTALITGASSGLGAEFARQLAARGANLVLVARRAERLEALASELRDSAGVTVTVITADLASADAGTRLAADVESRGIQISTLINNAGFGSRNRFEDEDQERIREEILLNVAALVDLTKAFYPQLQAASNGALVNVASTAAYQPLPKMAVYGATKAFVLSFTEALWHENKGTALKVLCLSPGGTATEFFEVAGDRALVGPLRPVDEVVALTLKALDRKNTPPSVVSGALNHVNSTLIQFFPRRARVNISGMVAGR